MKPNYINALVTAIISLSTGTSQEKIVSSTQEILRIESTSFDFEVRNLSKLLMFLSVIII